MRTRNSALRNRLILVRKIGFCEYAADTYNPHMESGSVKVLEPQKGDPLQRMRVYRIACELLPQTYQDAEQLAGNEITQRVSAQLYAAVGSIAANLGEGYAHSSGKDRARIFEYALGSARESTTWYEAARPVLGGEVVDQRVAKLDEIRRMLLAIIPRERDRLIRPGKRSSQ